MTNEELLAKLENATEDETVELMKEFVGATDYDGEELSENELEDVAGGVRYVSSVGMIYSRYNRLSRKEKEKWKKKLNELIKKLLKFGEVAMPF